MITNVLPPFFMVHSVYEVFITSYYRYDIHLNSNDNVIPMLGKNKVDKFYKC